MPGIYRFSVSPSFFVGADFESQIFVHQKRGALFSLVQFMVFPHRVLEESLQDILFFQAARVDDVHQIAVVHHDSGRFFGKGFSFRVNHVDEPRVGQILDVVHNRGPRRVDVFRQLADVGSHRTVYREQI